MTALRLFIFKLNFFGDFDKLKNAIILFIHYFDNGFVFLIFRDLQARDAI